MGTTPKGIRYIDPDQPIRLVAAAMSDMADDVDGLLGTINEGPEGPPGPAGGTDAATAAWLDTGALTGKALARAVPKTLTKKDRALRKWWVAALNADTTPADIVFVTSDSIGAGAYAGSGVKKFISVTRDKLRRALQPSGVVGGYGYYNFAANPILTGEGFVGATGSTTVATFGLGLRGITLANAGTLTFYFVGTSAKIIYRKDPAGGTFTYTVDSLAGPGPVNTAGAAGSAEVAVGPYASGIHTVVITATSANVNLEGVFSMDGDETKGVRMWEGSHSGYGATEFQTTPAWADSLARVPSPKLGVMPVGSNDYYNGRTVAATKAAIQANIATTRAAYGADFPIVLVAYYDRPPGAAVAPWSDFVAMYHAIADADDNTCVFDAGPLFGTMTGPTDDRGGLTTALVGDYVHPTPAGHQLLGNALADFLMPAGAAGSGGIFNVVPDNQKPASTPQLTAMQGDQGPVYAANFGSGVISLAGFHIATYVGYELTLTANATFSATGRPGGLTAGRAASFWIACKQDATGNRTLGLGADVLKAAGVAAPVLSTAAAAYDILFFRWTGTRLILTNFLKGVA